MGHERLGAVVNRRLRLTAIRDPLDSRLDEAGRCEMSRRETLDLLCGRQIAREDERRIQVGMPIAHFAVDRTNRTVSEWGVVFGDAIAGTAILDRLLHHSHRVTIPTKSVSVHQPA